MRRGLRRYVLQELECLSLIAPSSHSHAAARRSTPMKGRTVRLVAGRHGPVRPLRGQTLQPPPEALDPVVVDVDEVGAARAGPVPLGRDRPGACPWPGASAAARPCPSPPRSRSRRESGQALHAPLGLLPFPLPGRSRHLRARPDGRPVQEARPRSSPPALPRQLEQPLSRALLGPADGQPRGQPPRSRFGGDRPPRRAALAPPRDGPDPAARAVRRRLAAPPRSAAPAPPAPRP